MTKKKPKIISSFDVEEVSFVAKGANRKKFIITKKEDQVPLDHEKILKNIELKREDAEKQVAEVFKGEDVSAEGMQAMQSALAMLRSVRESLPKGVEITITDSSELYDGVRLSIRKGEMQDDLLDPKTKKKKKKNPSIDLGEMKVEKFEDVIDLIEKSEGLDEDQKESLTQIIKMESPMSPEDKEKIEKAEAIIEKNKVLSERIEKLEEDKRITRVEKDANQFPFLDKEAVLKSLEEASKAGDVAYEAVKKSFVSANEAAKTANTIIEKELGHNDEESFADDPFHTRAVEIQKSENITYEQAYSKAMVEM